MQDRKCKVHYIRKKQEERNGKKENKQRYIVWLNRQYNILGYFYLFISFLVGPLAGPPFHSRNIYNQIFMRVNLHYNIMPTGLSSISVSSLRTVPHKYEVILAPETWPFAQKYCRVMYNDLATVQSDTDLLRFQKETLSNGLFVFWSGLYIDMFSWRWTLNNISLTNVTYSNWFPGDPDNFMGEELCVAIAGNNQWRDVPCTLLRPFICYNGESILVLGLWQVSSLI